MLKAARQFPGLTICTLIALAVLLRLGFWQVDRLAEKTELLATIDAGFKQSPEPLPLVIDDPQSWNYKRVVLSGVFDHNQEIHLFGMSVSGQGGYHILTPFHRPGGQTFLVDRGWVPKEKLAPSTRAEGQITGTVEISGISRIPVMVGSFAPKPDIDQNEWFSIDLAAMGEALGTDLAPVIVEADTRPNPGGFPIGGQTRVDIPNDHLQYAVTWFGFAIVLVVIYIVYVRRHR